jgi:hypothetical protein
MLTRRPSKVGSCSSALRLCGANFLFGDGGRRVEHGGEGLAAVLGVARALRQRFGVEDFEELEIEVAAVDDPRHGQAASKLSEKRPRW